MSNLRWGFLAAAAAMIISSALGVIFGVSFFHIFVRAAVFSAVFFGFGFGLKLIINNYFPELLFTDNESNGLDSFNNMSTARVSIVQDNTGEYAVPELYKTPGDPDELGNIEDLISGAFKPRSTEPAEQPIDRKQEAGYNDMGDFFDVPELESMKFQGMDVPRESQAIKPEFTPEFGDDSGSLGGLPDLDAMAMAFGIGSAEGGGAPPPRSAAVSVNSQAASFEFDSVSDFNGGISAGSFALDTGPSSSIGELEPAQSNYVGNKPQPLQGDFNPKELAEGIRTVLSKDNK